MIYAPGKPGNFPCNKRCLVKTINDIDREILNSSPELFSFYLSGNPVKWSISAWREFYLLYRIMDDISCWIARAIVSRTDLQWINEQHRKLVELLNPLEMFVIAKHHLLD